LNASADEASIIPNAPEKEKKNWRTRRAFKVRNYLQISGGASGGSLNPCFQLQSFLTVNFYSTRSDSCSKAPGLSPNYTRDLSLWCVVFSYLDVAFTYLDVFQPGLTCTFKDRVYRRIIIRTPATPITDLAATLIFVHSSDWLVQAGIAFKLYEGLLVRHTWVLTSTRSDLNILQLDLTHVQMRGLSSISTSDLCCVASNEFSSFYPDLLSFASVRSALKGQRYLQRWLWTLVRSIQLAYCKLILSFQLDRSCLQRPNLSQIMRLPWTLVCRTNTLLQQLVLTLF